MPLKIWLEKTLVERATKNGVKILPKDLAHIVPIKIVQDRAPGEKCGSVNSLSYIKK